MTMIYLHTDFIILAQPGPSMMNVDLLSVSIQSFYKWS